MQENWQGSGTPTITTRNSGCIRVLRKERKDNMTDMNNQMTRQQAKYELLNRLRALGGIALVWGILMLILGSKDISRWVVIRDAIDAALAIYLPYRLGKTLTGTPLGGTVISLLILVWMSTWINGREWLVILLLIVGYVIDFGPCILALLSKTER